MKKKIINGVVFTLSSICFIISVKLFFNMMVFADEYNTSPDIICGGEFWLNLTWIRLGLLFIISFISGVKLFMSNGGSILKMRILPFKQN